MLIEKHQESNTERLDSRNLSLEFDLHRKLLLISRGGDTFVAGMDSNFLLFISFGFFSLYFIIYTKIEAFLFSIVIYNCKYIFSRRKGQIFYCYIQSNTLDWWCSKSKNQTGEKLWCEEGNSYASIQKHQRETCCNLQGLYTSFSIKCCLLL